MPVETQYNTHNMELLAVVEFLKEWSHQLLDLGNPFVVIIDHANLKYFITTKTLLRR